jgi:hypothetical protein
MTTTQTTEYAKGYDAAVQAITILEGQMSERQLLEVAIRNIIPARASRDHGDYDHGSSEAWSDWQQAKHQAAKRAAQHRYFAGRR